VAQADGTAVSMYLRVLGLTRTSTSEDVNRAFRALAQECRPDHGGDAAMFRELVEAKERALDELASA